MAFERSEVVKSRVKTVVSRNCRGGLLSRCAVLVFGRYTESRCHEAEIFRCSSILAGECRKKTWQQLTTISQSIVNLCFIGHEKVNTFVPK